MSKSVKKPVRKYSIKDVDSLIESIRSKEPSLTEEAICEALDRSPGYIAQLRSRENAPNGTPQVSSKFIQALKDYNARLQNANSVIDILGPNLESIAQTLKAIQVGQHAIKAEVRGYGQYLVMNANDFDEDRYRKAKELVDKIYFANLPKDDGRSKKNSNGI